MPDKPMELRTVEATFEMRDDAGAPVLEGYAATFGDEYDLGPFRERIEPQAFNRTLSSNPDVRLLIDHEGQPLARTKSGTLTLSPDSTGLHVRASLEPSDPDVQRLLPKMRRGDLDQMSFAFRVPEGGDSWSPDFTLRSIREINLSGGDVSVVTYPANPNTSASVRNLDLLTAQRSLVLARLERVWEGRAGRAISADNMDRLQRVLEALASADDNLDAAEAAVAEILGVADPDNDDGAQQNSGIPLGLAQAIARRLDFHAA